MKYFLPALFFFLCMPVLAHAQVIDIAFPVEGDVEFIDDFNQSRGSHVHHATDIMADKMQRVFAAADGVITFAPDPEPSYGFYISMIGDDGYEYNYVHLNNDTPGTDDGAGGAQYAYAPGIRRGARVVKGQHIAWVGDSGNAETIGSHLHFEIYDGNTAINPYASLIAAQNAMNNEENDFESAAFTFDPIEEQERATSISDDKGLLPSEQVPLCKRDSLIRTEEVSTVYYCGADGGRYAFQNEDTYFSWYDDFDDVEYVTTEDMGNIPLRGVVTYKPGTYMVKLLSSPKVYAISAGGTLHEVLTESDAEALYGEEWASLVRDLSDAFFPAYRVGPVVERE